MTKKKVIINAITSDNQYDLSIINVYNTEYIYFII